ncbi:MAG: protein kinase [Archangium sp.]|nr:protein kinase [Archangium sp.]
MSATYMCQACGTEHSAPDGKCPSCGAFETIRLQQNVDRMLERVIKGKYKILKKLGQGGMGAVYLAEQLGIGHRVALKFLKSEFSADAEIARRFLNEAKSYARVAHPNAVTLHDFGQDEDGNLFIAMEYCEGVDLKRVISEQKHLPLGEAAEVVLQVADVLANAHSKGVIHRDLKPENIMIRRGLRGVHAKVLDFGIARLMDAGTRLTVAGAIAGTPRYMSPEQVEGREVDVRADIYSLGIVLFESLTGRQPFDGTTISEILRRQVAEPMPHLGQVAADLDFPALDAVIQKACAKKRDERWPDMLSFAHALSQALPTQANLSVSSLNLGNALPTTTPIPLIGTATNASGIAVPGAATTDDDFGSTMVKAATPAVGALTPLPSTTSTNTTGPGVRTQLDGPAQGVSLDASLVNHTSLPPQAPASKGPLVAVGAAVLTLAVGGAVLLMRGPGTPSPVVTPPPVTATPTPTPKPDVPPAAGDPGAQMVAQVSGALREEAALNNLGKAKTEFELAKLDESETYLLKVTPDTTSHVEALAYLEKIKSIRELVKAGQAAVHVGNCPKAMPLFQQALKLNSKLPEGLDGVRKCRAATVDTTMDP